MSQLPSTPETTDLALKYSARTKSGWGGTWHPGFTCAYTFPTFLVNDLNLFHKAGFLGNPEFATLEMRETLGFPFHKRGDYESQSTPEGRDYVNPRYNHI